jgi:hypothetical protein
MGGKIVNILEEVVFMQVLNDQRLRTYLYFIKHFLYYKRIPLPSISVEHSLSVFYRPNGILVEGHYDVLTLIRDTLKIGDRESSCS